MFTFKKYVWLSPFFFCLFLLFTGFFISYLAVTHTGSPHSHLFSPYMQFTVLGREGSDPCSPLLNTLTNTSMLLTTSSCWTTPGDAHELKATSGQITADLEPVWRSLPQIQRPLALPNSCPPAEVNTHLIHC